MSSSQQSDSHCPRDGSSSFSPRSWFRWVSSTDEEAHYHGSQNHRPRVDERDLCPICNRLLPPVGPDGNEEAREAHVRECVESHDHSASAEHHQHPIHPHPMRLVAFTATEKDCTSHDGATPECSICMEEYEVGQPLVRLECLCKFHKQCIAEWFGRKRECPVHKTI